MLQALGVFFLIFGLFFSVMGVIGNIRLPDVFTRLHATGKVSIMGIMGLALASALLVPETTPKAIALSVLVLFAAPVSTHAIARAAYYHGCAMVGLRYNDLAAQAAPSTPGRRLNKFIKEPIADLGNVDLPTEVDDED